MSTRIQNIADQIALHGRQRPTHIALIQGDRSLDYRSLDQAVQSRAAWLQMRGLAPGSVVGLALKDTIEHVLMIFAVARAGCIVLPVDCRWKTFEKQAVSKHFGASLVMVEPGQAFEGQACQETDGGWLDAVRNARPVAPFPDGDRGLVMSLSSGTTGRPKGPLLSHQRLISRFYTQWADLGFGSRERYVNATPLYFGGGRTFTLSILYAGGTVVLCPPPYAPEELVGEVARTQGSLLFLVPTLLRRLLDFDAETLAPLRRLRTLVSSGSALAAEERVQIREKICPNFYEYYASTEGGGISVLTPADQLRYMDSVGRPAFGVEVSVVDERHEPVPAGAIGRIRYRSNGMAEGFYGDAEASAEVFRDGWFYPGDLGAMNEEGYLFLKGRAKDMIIRGGVNIYPQEIEAVLTGHPAVQEAAVVGWPSRQFNEEIAAFVIPKEPVDPGALIALCRDALAPYKVPREIFFVREFPRNSIGKVLKAELAGQLTPI
ncbi:class I adenylate-forming enzyme family protein [Parapusillimonas granuli]|uniref:Acyl--CoA ligase n=1 Tax=Parapusillimonas granuli TaxID=380911 RepID=A0A853FV70_9BURK|nr:class I adenylate-forming enzyme family protein [Parapusillimonas granuli]MBB5213665.1 acyl-CoA synthetase (AMP-forming)/AMP-acid ligase II [Parapusillimonas granuli]NYT48503.1 acyl--CoA ligase [Parapusillimonas granuli]